MFLRKGYAGENFHCWQNHKRGIGDDEEEGEEVHLHPNFSDDYPGRAGSQGPLQHHKSTSVLRLVIEAQDQDARVIV